MNSIKGLLSNLGIILLLVGIGFGLGILFNRDPQIPTSQVPSLDSLFKKEWHEIDSLNKLIINMQDSIHHLEDSVKVIEVIKTTEINKVKELPIDSATLFLKLKLKDYEEFYK